MTLSVKAWRRTAAAIVLAGSAVLPVTGGPATVATADGAARQPACRTSQLTVWWGMPGSGAAGSVYYELQLSNVSTTTCSLRGFLGVSAVTGTGRQLGSPALWDRATAPTTVLLAPGATAHAVLRVTDVGVYPPATCRPVTAAGLKVYPPDQSTAAFVPLQIRACAKQGPSYLTVRTVRPRAGIPGYSQ